MTNTDKTKLYYDQIIDFIDQSLAAVLKKTSTTNGNIDLEAAIFNSKALLESFREKSKEDIRELRDISEWKAFTIAFYGETNAGKSTIIEALRILLGDSEKISTQKRFKILSEELGVDAQSLAALDKSITQLKSHLSESQKQAEILKNKIQHEEQQKIIQLNILKTTIEHKRKNLNFWQKLVFLFKKLEEEKILPEQELELVQFQAGNKSKFQSIDADTLKISNELDARLKDQSKVESSLAQLAPLQDGSIIGNGRSDFTLESQTYRFMIDNQEFQFIDVPGIEGDEKQVMSAIESSVKKAHAVFYITRTATPPGSGSEGQEGTIGKVKRQLGKQTEVWAVYNKSATNPQVLQGATLINQNDSIGLVDMDKSLTGTLGLETYKGHICVSGMPAFLVSASCFVPNNPHIKSREKFLAAMNVDETLQRSGMNNFLKFIRNEICQNFKNKIYSANLKKIRTCLQEGIDHLQQAQRNFDNATEKLEAQQKSASTQIDVLLAGTSQKLKSECHDQLSERKIAIRSAIYDYIDENHSNDDFKERLTAEIEELKTNASIDLEKRFAKVFDIFKIEVGEIIKKNQKNVDDILRYTIEDPFSSLKLNFQTDFKMDNGINVIGLISSLGGAATVIWGAFLASNPVGLTIAGLLSTIGLVFSFYKAVRSWWSSDYKKEQQRKSVDENLNKVFSKLTEVLDGNLESASTKINEALLETKNQIRIPYEQSLNTSKALNGIASKMIALRDKIALKQHQTVASSEKLATNISTVDVRAA